MKPPERPEQPAHRIELQDMSPDDIARTVSTVGDAWPADANQIEAVCWHDAQGRRCEKVTVRTAHPPRCRIWRIDDRLRCRPATDAELVELVAVLRDVGASEEDVAGPVAEAHFDCDKTCFELSFTALSEMIEGISYKRWQVQYHGDGRHPSVAFVLETRRGNWWTTLPGGAVLRGTPWEP